MTQNQILTKNHYFQKVGKDRLVGTAYTREGSIKLSLTKDSDFILEHFYCGNTVARNTKSFMISKSTQNTSLTPRSWWSKAILETKLIIRTFSTNNFINNNGNYSNINNAPTPINSDNIPWNNTKDITNAHLTLQRMFEYSKSYPVLYNYLKDNCDHLLNSLPLDTGISTKNLALDKLDSNELILLNPSYTKSLTLSVEGKSGVYFFINNNTTELVYVGSTINFIDRLKFHYSEAKDSEREFYNYVRECGGFSQFSLYFPHVFDSYVLSFNKIKRIDPKIDYILKSFCQFEARKYEQALITYFKPKLNPNVRVTFPFTNWDAENINLFQGRNSIPVSAISADGEQMEFPSVKNAALHLEISQRTIVRSCNCIEPNYVWSPTFNKSFQFLIKAMPLKQTTKEVHVLEDIKDIDLTLIPHKKIAVYHSDKTTLFGLFDTVVEARSALFIDESYQIWKYVNKEYLIYSKELNNGFYLVKNPNFSNKEKCKLTNTETGEIILFDSISDLIRHFNLSIGFNSKLKKNYILANKLFRKIYKIELTDE